MNKPSDETEMFRMNLAWEDEDEVVVKLEPLDSPIVPRVGRERDLIPNEEWTRDGDIRRRSYTNKRRLIKDEIKEISFRMKNSAEKDEETSPLSKSSPSCVAKLTSLRLRENVKNIDVLEDFSDHSVDLISSPISPLKSQVEKSTARTNAEIVGAPYKSVKQVAKSTSQQDRTPTKGAAPPKKCVDSVPPTVPKHISVPIPAVAKSVIIPNRTGQTTTPIASKPVVPKTTGKPRIVALFQNKIAPQQQPGKVVYLTPVPKEVVMRSKSAVRVLPESIASEPAPPPKLPIYLRKAPDSSKLYKRKTVSLASSEISYTGIYSSNAEPMMSGRKLDANEMIEHLPIPPAGLQSSRRVRKLVAIPKESRKLAKEVSYKCGVCDKMFTKSNHLHMHSKIHTGEKRVPTKPCPECGKLFVDNTQLRIHSRVHTGDKPFSCSICQKKFKHQTSLSRHWQFHTKERPFSCAICTKTYRNKSDLLNHMRVHTDERPFACKFCDKRFNDRCAKNTHERIHLEKKFKCPICVRVFAQSTTLRGHMVTHTEERPFSCVLCDMKFKSKVVLRSHERVHTAGKTFKCEFCNLLFTEKRTLARHAYTHKEKPFPCSFCKRWYFRRERYLAHLETHNTRERPFKCSECHKCYLNEGYLKLHTLKAHGLEAKEGKVYTCKFKSCRETFHNLILLTRHLSTHGDIFILECDICKKRFAKKKTLQMHMIKGHKFAHCYLCGKCDKAFIRKSVLAHHIRVKCC